MWPSFEPAPPADERDARFDAAAAGFAAPLARLAAAFEDESAPRAALLDDIHVALWRSLANYDGRIALRTWVFRVAFHLVAAQQPNTHDRPPYQDTAVQAWKRRRVLKSQRTLDEATAPGVATTGASVTGFIQGLQPQDRELVFLCLEGIDIEGARDITGWTAARLESAYERISKLLGPGAREGWQRQFADASPGSRFQVRQRMQELNTRWKREGLRELVFVPVVSSLMALYVLGMHRRNWLAMLAIALLAFIVFIEAFQRRRRRLEAPGPHVTAGLDSLAFQRHLLEQKRDELRGTRTWKECAFLGAWLAYMLSFPLGRGTAWTWPLAGVAAGVVFFGLSWWWNRQGAALLRRQMDSVTD
ncbi:MAG TPA: hypothetical protein VFB99_23840 [Vicinamibacterales bacterium]|nr:hypothetical protein [Vicinamibacterales bacterium]